MPRPKENSSLTQHDKYLRYRAAYSKLNEYIKCDEYIAAHVIAFSILEDRVLANRITCEEFNGEFMDAKIDKNKIPFERSVKKLLAMNVVSEELHNTLIDCGKERNEFIHQAMWRLDEFNKSSILRLRKTINALEKCKKDYVKKPKNST